MTTEIIEGDLPFVISCGCGVGDEILSKESAILLGWDGVRRDEEDSEIWNYLGTCPECQIDEEAERQDGMRRQALRDQTNPTPAEPA